jgi:hypothetical protein
MKYRVNPPAAYFNVIFLAKEQPLKIHTVMKIKNNHLLGLINRSLKISASSIPTLAIIAYFSGWQYVNEYFSSFNINRSSFSFTDYTTFTHSFSVLANMFPLITGFDVDMLKWLLPILLLIIGPVLVKRISKKLPRLTILNIWSWACLITALFYLSQQAGELDANKVKNGNARPVEIVLSESFKKNLMATGGKEWAAQRIEEINRASKNKALALIWRNSNETILLLLGDSGDTYKKPIEVLRINNGDIVAIFAAP